MLNNDIVSTKFFSIFQGSDYVLDLELRYAERDMSGGMNPPRSQSITTTLLPSLICSAVQHNKNQNHNNLQSVND